MKLATVNPWTEFNMESQACKDVRICFLSLPIVWFWHINSTQCDLQIYELRHRGTVAFPSEIPAANVTPVFPFVPHTQMQSSTLRKSGGMQLPMATYDGFHNLTSQTQQQQVPTTPFISRIWIPEYHVISTLLYLWYFRFLRISTTMTFETWYRWVGALVRRAS